MIKKSLILLILTVTLAGCTWNNKWYQPDPNMPEIYIQKHREQLEQSLETLKKDDKNVDALFQVAFRYDQLGNYKDAVSYYEKVLNIDPSHFASRNNIAIIYEKVEEYDKSAENIKKLYSINQTDKGVINHTVRILLKANQPVLAQQALENFAKQTRDESTPELVQFISDLYDTIHNNKNNK